MEVVILALIVIGILLAIASGIWVAIALVRAISAHPVRKATDPEHRAKWGISNGTHRAEPGVPRQKDEENANKGR